ncbi:hypothetical protein BFP76_01855 [Amylibacter kogurei]|uniref:Protein TolA n=1 Tax=Paramylibacter kogurei TaxID=1889778 RepID=A0A2G5K566_9RHOB|nr:hypothetical protein [Amylibacter kogurei]PIB24020.1 hypothetical protein BFP76_01855 [Amylibacter kogurei]
MSFDREKWTIIGGVCAMVLSGGLVAATWIGGPADVVAIDDQVPERTLNAQKEIEDIAAAEKAAKAKEIADQKERDRIAEIAKNKAIEEQIERERMVKLAAEEHEQEVAAQFIASKVTTAEIKRQSQTTAQDVEKDVATPPVDPVAETGSEIAQQSVTKTEETPAELAAKAKEIADQKEAERVAEEKRQKRIAQRKLAQEKEAAKLQELKAAQERAQKLAARNKAAAEKRQRELASAQKKLEEAQKNSIEASMPSAVASVTDATPPSNETMEKAELTKVTDLEVNQDPIAQDPPNAMAQFNVAMIAKFAKEKDIARAKMRERKLNPTAFQPKKAATKSAEKVAKTATNNANLLPRVAKNSVAAQIAACWKSPQLFAENNDNRITLRVALNKQGFMLSSPKLTNWTADNFARSDGFSMARRALTRCQPYQLPVQSYASWRNLSIVFGPKSVSVK